MKLGDLRMRKKIRDIKWTNFGEWRVPCHYETEVGTAEMVEGNVRVYDENDFIILDLKNPYDKKKVSIMLDKIILKKLMKRLRLFGVGSLAPTKEVKS
jgi:hypothetical protein